MSESYINTDGDNTWFGLHYILDMYGIKEPPQNILEARSYLESAARTAGATILHSHIHEFGNGGFSGAVILQESHISIHTWPEKSFAAVDVYMCGNCNPLAAIKFLIDLCKPDRYEYVDIKRGLSPNLDVDNSIILQ